jgi:hypothetical protein
MLKLDLTLANLNSKKGISENNISDMSDKMVNKSVRKVSFHNETNSS